MSTRPDTAWEAGFEADRRLVVARLWGLEWSFPMPRHYVKRFHHELISIPIEDWELDVEQRFPGGWCRVQTRLTIRFQPTCRLAKSFIDNHAEMGAMIRQQYRPLIEDRVVQTLESLPPDIWLSASYADIEDYLEMQVQTLLAVKDIQSRCHCSLQFDFNTEQPAPEHEAALDLRYQDIVSQLKTRLHEARLRAQREAFAQKEDEARLRIEHEQGMIALLKQETEVLQQRQEEESRKAKTTIAIEEVDVRERYESELRLRLEQIHQEALIRQAQLESELAEKNQRAVAMSDVEQHLHREIEFLTLERQRILLEEEIQESKLARLKGWSASTRPRLTAE